MNYTKEQLSVIYGSLLGDAYLEKGGYFRIEQAICDKEYVWWKWDILKNLCNKLPIERQRERLGKITKNVRFNTRPLSSFRETFYKDGKKVITSKILQNLDKLAIAVWWMDDGCFNQTTRSKVPLLNLKDRSPEYSLNLSLDCYTEEEVNLAKDYFKSKWNVEWLKTRVKENQWVLRMYKKSEIKNFISLIGEYIIPSMSRKNLITGRSLKTKRQDIV